MAYKILLVDDEKGVVDMMKDYFELSGYQVMTAYSGAEAADIAVSDEGFTFVMAAGIMVCVLLLLAAGLVIYNILKIAVSRCIKQYGVLRAIGGEKGQLYFLITAQVLLLCAIGIPIGLILGGLSAKVILTAATGFLSPEIFLVQDSTELNKLIAENSSGKWAFLLISAVITLIFALMAALPAARFAAKVSPVIAISGTNAKVKRKKRNVRQIRNFERYYARLNLKRNKGRTAITILSLVMSITVFIALQGSVALLNAAGSTIVVAGKELLVVKTLDGYDGYLGIGNSGFTNGIQVVVDHTLYPELTGKSEYNELLPTLEANVERDLYDQTIEVLAGNTPGTTWISYEETDRQLAESFEQIRLLAWGLILFVPFIGILNIINTVYTNIHTRVTEIGMLGYLCTILINAATIGNLDFTTVPILSIMEATVLAITACLLATAVPLRLIAKLSIVESIETVE